MFGAAGNPFGSRVTTRIPQPSIQRTFNVALGLVGGGILCSHRR